MSAEFHTEELKAFAATLDDAGLATEKGVTAVVSKGALNIKNQLVEEMRSSTHFAPVARSISYDLRGGSAFGGGIVEAEIGPEKGRPGSLANIAYFGTSRGGGTVRDPRDALDEEAPRFEKALLDLAERSLR